MADRILVAYASRAGSTAGVAEAIGKTLAESGAQVEVCSVTEVKDFAPYRAVVAGSAIQGGQWLPEAMQFMQTHRAELARKPFAMFLVCMTLSMRNADQYREHVATWLNPVRALVKPVLERHSRLGHGFEVHTGGITPQHALSRAQDHAFIGPQMEAGQALPSLTVEFG